jgi:hypothetical protein
MVSIVGFCIVSGIHDLCPLYYADDEECHLQNEGTGLGVLPQIPDYSL